MNINGWKNLLWAWIIKLHVVMSFWKIRRKSGFHLSFYKVEAASGSSSYHLLCDFSHRKSRLAALLGASWKFMTQMTSYFRNVHPCSQFWERIPEQVVWRVDRKLWQDIYFHVVFWQADASRIPFPFWGSKEVLPVVDLSIRLPSGPIRCVNHSHVYCLPPFWLVLYSPFLTGWRISRNAPSLFPPQRKRPCGRIIKYSWLMIGPVTFISCSAVNARWPIW